MYKGERLWDSDPCHRILFEFIFSAVQLEVRMWVFHNYNQFLLSIIDAKADQEEFKASFNPDAEGTLNL